MLPTIFISHKSEDKAIAIQILEFLREQGYPSERLFLDSDPKSGLLVGNQWEPELYQRLQKCVCLIVVGTTGWVASKWCFTEAFIAKNRAIPIVVLRCDDEADLSILGEYQAVASFSADADGLDRLLEILRQNQLEPFTGDAHPSAGWTRAAAELDDKRQQELAAELLGKLQPDHKTRRAAFSILALMVPALGLIGYLVLGDWIKYQLTGRVAMTGKEFADGADAEGLASFIKKKLDGCETGWYGAVAVIACGADTLWGQTTGVA